MSPPRRPAPAAAPFAHAWAQALARRGAWWWVPLVLSVLFTLAVAVWLQRNDQRDVEERQRQLISDSLSLERQISGRVGEEQLRLDALARDFDPGAPNASFAAQPGIVEGLQRLWQSVAWVDAQERLRAVVPERADLRDRSDGLSAHLSAPLKDAAGRPAGHLVVRYAPGVLLRQSVPWWLAREYQVRLVDGFGQVLSSYDPLGPGDGGHETHRVHIDPALPDAWLELATRDTHWPWWRSFPIVLMAVFLALIGAATALLRWQMNEVLRTQAALRTEAAWRQAMEDSLTVGLRARDEHGRLVYVNRAFCDLVGWTAEELVGMVPPYPYWPPDSIEESMQRHRRNLSGHAPREGYETRWIRRDGRPVDVMLFEAPLVDAQGGQVGWMGSILDITERRRLEERERRQTEAMAHQGRLTMLGEVASALAHQLNQPLTSITGYAAGVQRLLERDGQADPRVRDAMARLAEQAAEAGRIVQRIREFLTRRGPQRETIDLAATVRRAVALQERELRRLRVHVEWAIPAGLPEVDADPVLVEQVVLNLVRNACDEMAGASGAAGSSDRDARPRRIRLSAGPSGGAADADAGADAGASAAGRRGYLRLDVDDSGPGLRGRAVESLMEPFYSTKPEGMGMGLAICRSIIEAHHGALAAGPSALGGARFSFTLPLAGGDGASEAREDAQAAALVDAVPVTRGRLPAASDTDTDTDTRSGFRARPPHADPLA
jgi:two-component system sensor histidine kinase DctS